ncbi:3-deoxy-7-phosphoheptulonate synthase [Thomasclavelia cocleata]|uniref:3-deoxy-7-phosphoheptulonate synthase n=1 Tax=Thomasclavelia cocleata TaxID=69824 RepID=UPI001C598CB4|nr:3-deoxy-7-phosphoheptulonate synthase [Thomasclavelia cocleata]
MIIVMKMSATSKDVEKVSKIIIDKGLRVSVVNGTGQSVIGIIGDTTQIDPKIIEVEECVEKVMKVSEPYKLANRAFHPDDTIVDVDGVKVGGENLALIAGPCSVESKEQVIEIAKAAKAAGANILRGGAFKPRTSPYAFQGMGSSAGPCSVESKEQVIEIAKAAKAAGANILRGGAFKPRTSPYAFQGMGSSGLDILVAAKEATGLPICSELMDVQYLDEFNEKVDLIQIGARNMQNFDLLKKVGAGTKKPILLKRGLSATFEEWIMSAEYIMANGNPNVILCERGIRTFETYTRNTLDLQAIPVVKKLTHLPIVIDPSHAGGKWWLVEPMAKASVAGGADGLMIEVHNNPEKALCDGPQSLRPERYEELLKQISKIAEVVGKKV